MIEIEVEREFQFGRKKPVMLKATAPVLQCTGCKTELHDWRMERAKSLAMSAYLKEHHKGEIEPPEDLRIGHAASSHHKKQLEKSGGCACFYCVQMFCFDEIDDWTDDGETAICPKCGIDAVIPADIIPEEGGSFVKRMQQYWFDAAATV